MAKPKEIVRRETTELSGNVEIAEQGRLDERGTQLLRRLVEVLRFLDHSLWFKPAAARVVQPINTFQDTLVRRPVTAKRGELRGIDERRNRVHDRVVRRDLPGKDETERQGQKFDSQTVHLGAPTQDGFEAHAGPDLRSMVWRRTNFLDLVPPNR